MKSRRRKIKKDKNRNKVSYNLECSFLENVSINKALLKIIAVLVVVSINGTGLLAVFFSALIDMPFTIFVEFIEQWRYFLKEKKEKIH